MNLTSQFSNVEQWFLVTFFLLYFIYLGRIFWIARRLDTTARSIILKFILRTVYFALILLSLLNPSFGEKKGLVKAEGKDVFLLIDISKSMDATDIQPSRLEKTKFEINRFINQFENDRLGLIVFSENALMLSPLTFDKNAINLFVPQIYTSLLPQGGTDFTPPLELAFNKLSNKNSKTQAKVIILISDGENFGSDNASILSKIRRSGINFYAVGVGTPDGIAIRKGNNYMKDEEGKTVITKLESVSLKKIADQTGGKYLEINTVSDSFNQLINEVEQIAESVINSDSVDVIANKYFYFLIIALILLGIDVFFTVRTFQL